jgi:hypothetical protein
MDGSGDSVVQRIGFLVSPQRKGFIEFVLKPCCRFFGDGLRHDDFFAAFCADNFFADLLFPNTDICAACITKERNQLLPVLHVPRFGIESVELRFVNRLIRTFGGNRQLEIANTAVNLLPDVAFVNLLQMQTLWATKLNRHGTRMVLPS